MATLAVLVRALLLMRLLLLSLLVLVAREAVLMVLLSIAVMVT